MKSELIAGRYKQLRVLGQGGMGTVYLVEDTLQDNEQFALKTQVLTDESVRLVGALKHEFRTLSRLSHPNVARVYDFGTLEQDQDEPRRFYFTTEYVAGKPLLEASENAAWDDIYEIAAQLLRALSYVHAHGIVHRDIKPANVLVREDGVVKLVDFGVVTHSKFEFAGNTLVGTPSFTAPELIRGDILSPGADLYATGVSLYQVVTRRLPFEADTVREMLSAHLKQKPRPAHAVRNDTPKALSSFIERLLAKEPSARFATAGRALAGLSNVAGKTFSLDTPETHVGYISSGQFVGRQQELTRLKGRAEQRVRKLGRAPAAVSVIAPFGIGKTRLLREFRVAQQLAETPVFVTEIGPSADPLEPWNVLVGQVKALVGHTGSIDTVGAFLADAARSRPFILVLDDLHQADDAALDVLENVLELLARSTQPTPMFLVAALEDTPGRAVDRAGTWHERGLLDQMRLTELSQQDTSRLAASMLGAETLPADTAERLHKDSHGNPYVLSEILAMLSRTDKVERLPSGQVNVQDFTTPEIPSRVVDALRARVDGLSAGARNVLDALGVLRRPADADAMAAMGIEDTEATGEAISELVRVGVASRTSDGRVVLQPMLVVTVEDPKTHRRAGEYIESLDEGDEAAAELALHFQRAGDREREAKYARAAGLRLKRRYANHDALRFLGLADGDEVALAMAEIEALLGRNDEAARRIAGLLENKLAPEVEAGAHLVAARLAAAAGNAEDSRAAHQRARDVAPSGTAIAARALAQAAHAMFEQGDTDEAIALAESALGELSESEFTREAAELHYVLGLAERVRSGPDVAEPHIANARRAFTTAGDRRGEARANLAMGRIQYLRGHLPEAGELFRAAAEGFLAVADLQGRANTQMNLAVLLHASSDYPGAIEAYHDALDIQQAGGSAREQALVGCNLGNLYCLIGSLDLAQQTTERSLELAREADLAQVVGYDLLVLGTIARSKGDPATAESYFREGQQILADAELKPWALIAEAKLADVFRDTGRWDEALQILVEAEKAARQLGAAATLARVLTSRGRLDVVRPDGDLDEASHMLAQALGLAKKEGDTELQGEIEHGLAILHAKRGDVEIAADILRTLAKQRETMRASLPPEYAAHFYDDHERRTARDALWQLIGHENESSGSFRELPSAASRRTPVPAPTPVPAETLDLTPTSAVWTSVAVKQLLSIVADLNAEHDTEQLLVKILDSAIALTRAERGFIIQIKTDGEERDFEIRSARNLDRADLPIDRFPVSRTIAEEVARSGMPVLSHDAVHDAQLRAGVSIQALGTQSILAVPLRAKGESIGAVWLEHRFQIGAFGDRETALAQTLADQAGTALENARLLELASARTAELETAQKEITALNKRLEARVEEQEEELAAAKELLTHNASEFTTRYDYSSIIGRSDALRKILRVIDRITDSDVIVLVEGESGTGKELVARALHANGPRSGAAFVSENCGAVPETLLESTLFGHVKGAFTGAVADRKGLFELADKGTLFLDEVGEMPAQMQVKLLRALQEGEVRRIGATSTIQVDARVVTATNRDLAAEVKAGRFREDLYYRLNVVRIQMPPLRDRKEDIPLLVEHILAGFAKEVASGRGEANGPTKIAKAALGRLMRYDWPGNVRELENVLKKAFVMGETDTIGAADLEDFNTSAPFTEKPSGREVPDDERDRMLAALEDAGGSVAQAAKTIGMPLRTFYYKLSKMGLARRGPRRS